MLRIAPVLLILLALLSACAEMTSVYHNRAIDAEGSSAITVDSYQRSVIFNRVGDGDMRICAEAAPDTFAALSASLAAQGSVVKKEASLASAISQSGATIERTQTINLLRESMYRTCERYMSGAISRETFIVQAARDQRAMVAVLAIEQLTRVAQPKATVISAGGTSASVPNSALVEMAASFKKERDDAQKAFDGAKDKFDKADAAGKCSTVSMQPADDSASPKKTDWDTCKTAQADQTARKGELDSAIKRLDQTLALSGEANTAGGISANTTQGPNDAGGGGGVLSDAAITKVAESVERIANAPGIDEAMMFCIGYLSVRPDRLARAAPAAGASGSDEAIDRDPMVASMCLDVIQQRAKTDEKLRVDTYNLGRAGVPGSSDPLVRAGDNAGPVLKTYLLGGKTAAERKRRRALASAAAKSLGYPSSELEVGVLVLTGDLAKKQALLDRLNTLETDAAAKKELAVPAA